MVQWQDPDLQARLTVVTMNMIFFVLGLYGYVHLIQETRVLESLPRWEYFQSLDVEYAVIRGRLSFRWPLVSSRAMILRAALRDDTGWSSLTLLDGCSYSPSCFCCKRSGAMVDGGAHSP